MIGWPESRVAVLRQLLSKHMSYTAISVEMGVSRNAVGSAVRRHIKQIVDPRTLRRRKADPKLVRRRNRRESYNWSETGLTETWAVRKVRLALEKSQ